MQNLKIIFMGSDSFVVPILQALQEHFTVVGVVTSADSPIAQYVGTKIPVFTPDKLDNEFNSQLSILNCQLIVVSSYGKIIPQVILDIPKFGALNVHPSLLPKYRGASPIQTAILNGDKKTGVTIMLMDAEMDHGPILSTKEVSISDQDTYSTLSTKMAQVATPLLIETLQGFIAGKIKPRLQHHAIASYCTLLKKESGYFDIEDPPSPKQLDRMIRAYYPWPGVWTIWRVKEKIVKFLPGGLLQMEGKKPISFKDFLNGYPDFPMSKLKF